MGSERKLIYVVAADGMLVLRKEGTDACRKRLLRDTARVNSVPKSSSGSCQQMAVLR